MQGSGTTVSPCRLYFDTTFPHAATVTSRNLHVERRRVTLDLQQRQSEGDLRARVDTIGNRGLQEKGVLRTLL